MSILKKVLFTVAILALIVLGVTYLKPVEQAAASDCVITQTLRLGSNSLEVACLQSLLGANLVADGAFGPKTQAAVVAFQVSKGLVADGIFGPISRSALVASGSVSGNFPVGCQSAAGYSPVTGVKCSGAVVVTPPVVTVEGEAGSIEVSDSSEFKNEEVEEGEENAEVLAFSVEADDESDVKVTSVKVQFENQDTVSSEDLDDYLDSVSILFKGSVVGSADVDEFSESNDVFSKTISLKGVVIGAGDEEDLVVAVSATNNVDSSDTDTDDWEVDVTSLRFEDGQGVVTTESGLSVAQNFDLVVAGDGESLDLKSSSDDIDSSTLLVDLDEESEFHEVFVFKLEADESDIELNELVLTVVTTGATYEELVAETVIEINGQEFSDYEVAGAASTTATLTFDLDGEATIDADDLVDVVVSMQFRSADGYADVGAETVKVSTVSVEGEGADDVSDTASITGSEHTLSTSTATVSNVSWSTSNTDTTGVIDFFFTVTAEEDDFDVLAASVLDDASGTLTRVSGDSVVTIAGGFTVAEGDTTRFRVRYNVSGAGSHEVTVTSVAGQAVDEDDQLSPTVILE